MTEIQNSLDQLLHVVKNSGNAERIHVYYVIEPKNSGRLKKVSDDEMILHISAQYKRLDISFESGSDMTIPINSDTTRITLDNKPYEFLEAIENIMKACTTRSMFLDERGRCSKPALSDFFEYVLKIFLDIIHWECENNAQLTAEKLISLRYPLFQVVSLGNTEVIEHMLVRGCTINERHPTEKFTGLSKAVRLVNLEMVKFLIKRGAGADLRDKYGLLPIAKYTIRYQDGSQQPEIIRILLDNTMSLQDSTPQDLAQQLQEAFQCGNKEVIQMLLEYHDNILNVRDVENKTPLHYLCENPHSDITDLLKDQEIDVNVRDETNCTPLYKAAESQDSHVNTLKFLLENGADINARNDFEFLSVPLFALCYTMNYDSDEKERYFKILDLFLQYDVDIQHVGPNQITVFDVIEENSSFYMSKPLLAHLAILEEQGQPIKELIRNKINSNQNFKNDFDLCKSELVDMKNYVINEKLTLYTIFLNRVSEKQILKSCRFSPNALTKFEKLEKEFNPDNCYYTVVQKCISSIASMLELLQKAAPILSQLLQLGNNPCHIIVTEIINYLDTQDLRTLIKVET